LDNTKRGTNYKARYREVTIKISDGTIIQGKINLSLNQRVSDVFTKSDSPFVIMVEAFSKEGEGKVLFINKKHIIWAEPASNMDDNI
jgi:hypothetical protein